MILDDDVRRRDEIDPIDYNQRTDGLVKALSKEIAAEAEKREGRADNSFLSPFGNKIRTIQTQQQLLIVVCSVYLRPPLQIIRCSKEEGQTVL